MTYEYETLISLFQEYLSGWSWEDWQAVGSSDREEVVVNALADLGPEMDVEEAYDIFYDWSAGLTPEDFEVSDSEHLSEWIRQNTSNPDPTSGSGSSSLKTYEVTYYEDGVKKTFTVQASRRSEAESIAWSRVDADSLYVTELD